MRVLLFGNLYAPEPTGVGPVSSQTAEHFALAGHEVKVVTANPSYPHWKLFPGYSAWRWSRESQSGVDVYRCPLYIPQKVGGLTRILHYGTFAASAAVPAMQLARGFRPDIVMLVAPTLMAAPLALATAKLAGARTWLHVQDFEVEAGFATGQLKAGGAVARAALAFEQACIGGFDETSSISPAMCRKLIDKGRSPETVHELRNWASIEPGLPKTPSSYRERWSIRTPHVALYSGSIAKKQGIEMIIDAARLLRGRDDITFVICGNGPSQPELRALAADLPHVQIQDLQPFDALADLLSLATIHLLPQRAGAADLVLPSKLGNMLASGRPVIVGSEKGRDLAREVEGCGLAVEPENAAAMAAAIEALAGDPQLHAAMSGRAVEVARQRWSRATVLSDFEQRLCRLAGSGQMEEGGRVASR